MDNDESWLFFIARFSVAFSVFHYGLIVDSHFFIFILMPHAQFCCMLEINQSSISKNMLIALVGQIFLFLSIELLFCLSSFFM